MATHASPAGLFFCIHIAKRTGLTLTGGFSHALSLICRGNAQRKGSTDQAREMWETQAQSRVGWLLAAASCLLSSKQARLLLFFISAIVSPHCPNTFLTSW